MKCPTCVEQGLKSTLTYVGSQSTLMGWLQWYDEEGVYHSHDPNRKTDFYRCSNGHNPIRSGRSACPAGDYGSEMKWGPDAG